MKVTTLFIEVMIRRHQFKLVSFTEWWNYEFDCKYPLSLTHTHRHRHRQIHDTQTDTRYRHTMKIPI